ncbi:MAG: hypothetical protein ACYSTL_02435 [Planctomycetota bacterium]|jgi:pimeloyl-ACP methyl ester carboxylesterase
MKYAPFIFFVLLLLIGCTHQPYRSEERLQRGLVIVLPGIEGRGPINEAICKGLDDGGVDWAIELHDWTSPLGLLYNLRAEDDNHRKASRVAWRITRYRWDYPNRPVMLIGQSGGAAIAVWAAEALLPGQQIAGVILLAASISPRYPLELTLENSERGVLNFHSPHDWVLLGLGTALVGTMDGEHTASAGQSGFEVPSDADSARNYDRLLQIGWVPQMAEAGHSGMHLTSGAEGYVSKYVAPFVLEGHWDEQLIESIIARHRPATAPAEPTGEQDAPDSAPTTRPATQPHTRPAPATAMGESEGGDRE